MLAQPGGPGGTRRGTRHRDARRQPRGALPRGGGRWPAQSLAATETPTAAGERMTVAIEPRAGPQVTAEVRDYRIYALGALRVEGPGGPLRGDWVEQRPGELLRFLVCARRQ